MLEYAYTSISFETLNLQPNPRVWEFLTSSSEENSSFPDRELENSASLESRVCEDLVYREGGVF